MKFILKYGQLILIVSLAIATGILAYLLSHQVPVTNTETIYIPENTIVETVVQHETIAVPEDQLIELIRNSFGDSFSEINRQIRHQNMSISALTDIVSNGTGESVVIEHVTDGSGHIVPADLDLHVTFSDVNSENNIEVPVAHVSLEQTGTLEASSYDMQLQLSSIVTETESAHSNISVLHLTSNGITYDLPINGTTYFDARPRPVPESGFRLLDPNLMLGIDVVASDLLNLVPGVSLSVMLSRYRQRDIDSWRFFGATVGMANNWNPHIAIVPVSYNLGHGLPIIRDLWLQPFIGIDIHQVPIYGLTIGTTL